MEDDKKYQEITSIIRHQELIKEVKQKPLDERMLVKPKSPANSSNNELQSSSKPYILLPEEVIRTRRENHNVTYKTLPNPRLPIPRFRESPHFPRLRLIPEEPLFDMEIEDVLISLGSFGNEITIITTGAKFIITISGIEMYSRIDPQTNDYYSRSLDLLDRWVASIEFEDWDTSFQVEAEENYTKRRCVVTLHRGSLGPVIFRFNSDSLFLITNTGEDGHFFTYTYRNRLGLVDETLKWYKTRNKNGHDFPTDRMWTDGRGGSLHLKVEELNSVLHRHSEDTDEPCTTVTLGSARRLDPFSDVDDALDELDSIPFCPQMAHMVFPPKRFDVNKLWGAPSFFYYENFDENRREPWRVIGDLSQTMQTETGSNGTELGRPFGNIVLFNECYKRSGWGSENQRHPANFETSTPRIIRIPPGVPAIGGRDTLGMEFDDFLYPAARADYPPIFSDFITRNIQQLRESGFRTLAYLHPGYVRAASQHVRDLLDAIGDRVHHGCNYCTRSLLTDVWRYFDPRRDLPEGNTFESCNDVRSHGYTNPPSRLDDNRNQPHRPHFFAQQSITETVSWMKLFRDGHDLDGFFFDGAFYGQAFYNTWYKSYKFLRCIRDEIKIGEDQRDIFICEHNSIDEWGGHSGVRAIMVHCYCDAQLAGESYMDDTRSEDYFEDEDNALVDYPDSKYLRYFVSGYGTSQTIGSYKPLTGGPHKRKYALSTDEAARVLLQNLHCTLRTGGQEKQWNVTRPQKPCKVRSYEFLKSLYSSRPFFELPLPGNPLRDVVDAYPDVQWPPSWFERKTGVEISRRDGHVIITWPPDPDEHETIGVVTYSRTRHFWSDGDGPDGIVVLDESNWVDGEIRIPIGESLGNILFERRWTIPFSGGGKLPPGLYTAMHFSDRYALLRREHRLNNFFPATPPAEEDLAVTVVQPDNEWEIRFVWGSHIINEQNQLDVTSRNTLPVLFTLFKRGTDLEIWNGLLPNTGAGASYNRYHFRIRTGISYGDVHESCKKIRGFVGLESATSPFGP